MRHKSLRNDVGKDYIHGSSNVAEGLKGLLRGYSNGLVSYHNSSLSAIYSLRPLLDDVP
jgi:hypothetical protein